MHNATSLFVTGLTAFGTGLALMLAGLAGLVAAAGTAAHLQVLRLRPQHWAAANLVAALGNSCAAIEAGGQWASTKLVLAGVRCSQVRYGLARGV